MHSEYLKGRPRCFNYSNGKEKVLSKERRKSPMMCAKKYSMRNNNRSKKGRQQNNSAIMDAREMIQR